MFSSKFTLKAINCINLFLSLFIFYFMIYIFKRNVERLSRNLVLVPKNRRINLFFSFNENFDIDP
jgi:hypothetical protein